MPNRLKLTDLTINTLKPGKTYWDTLLPAFGVRVGKNAKTFIVIQNGGRRYKLGRYPDTSLSQARQQAREIQSKPNSQVNSIPPVTFGEALETYYATHCLRNSEQHKREVKRLLDRHFKPTLQLTPLPNITTGDITNIIDPLVAPTPVLAAAAHRNVKTFFNWCLKRGYIKNSPCSTLGTPTNPVERDRVLSDNELKAVYLAAQELAYPFGFIVLIAIHTMLRRSNIGRMQWSWITPDQITIPADESKGDKEFILPNLINDNLQLLPRNAPLLFPSEIGTPFSAWSKNKVKLDAKIAAMTRKPPLPYTLHDLRRTGRTNLSKWKCCSPEIAERILGHATARTKVERIYDRWTYLPEMKEALANYERHLGHLIGS